MLFEYIVLIIVSGIIISLIGIPLIKLLYIKFPPKRDPVKEANIRLELARKEIEAARLNKEAEKLYQEMYQEMYQETLEDSEEKDKRKL